MDFLPIKRALLSVTHKDGLAEFAAFLHKKGVELVSTGGTMKFLKEQGLPVTAVSEVSEVERLSESLYDEGIHYLPNNVMIDSNHHAMVVMRLLLTMRSVSTIDNVRFLLRRRSVVPVYVNGEWIVEKQPISAYPRQLLLELLVQTIPQVLQQNQLVDLFNVLNAVGERKKKKENDG